MTISPEQQKNFEHRLSLMETVFEFGLLTKSALSLGAKMYLADLEKKRQPATLKEEERAQLTHAFMFGAAQVFSMLILQSKESVSDGAMALDAMMDELTLWLKSNVSEQTIELAATMAKKRAESKTFNI